MLDTSPRVVLVQNVGMFSAGKDLNAAKIAGDLTETNAKVITSVEETSSLTNLFRKKIFLMLNTGLWNKQKLKSKKETT